MKTTKVTDRTAKMRRLRAKFDALAEQSTAKFWRDCRRTIKGKPKTK